MLHDFLISNREEILRRSRERVSTRTAPKPTREELELGIPHFLDELITTLESGVDRSAVLDRDATIHGGRRQLRGFTVAQLVHDYGDLCQVVTQLAIERRAHIDTEDFKTLNRCLDDAIAHAVTEHARGRERSIADEEIERLGFLAHELRNFLHTASLSYDILRTGTVAIGGSTGAVLGRSLAGLRTLVDRTMAQVRLDAGVHHRERVEVSPFLEEMEAAGVMAAKERGMSLTVERGDAGVAVSADRQLLGSAVSNLLQNALKYTHENGHVLVRTSATPDRIAIEVADQCGGLQPAQIDVILDGLRRKSRHRSGMGLGLMISKRAIEAIGGNLRVHNHADNGCVFTIDLPRFRDPSSDLASAEHEGSLR